jgi:hypothetical protein
MIRVTNATTLSQCDWWCFGEIIRPTVMKAPNGAQRKGYQSKKVCKGTSLRHTTASGSTSRQARDTDLHQRMGMGREEHLFSLLRPASTAASTAATPPPPHRTKVQKSFPKWEKAMI